MKGFWRVESGWTQKACDRHKSIPYVLRCNKLSDMKMMAVEIGDQNFKHCKFWLSIFEFQRLDKRLEKLGPVEHFIILSANLWNFQLACQQNEHFGWTTPAAWWELACEITAVIFWKPWLMSTLKVFFFYYTTVHYINRRISNHISLRSPKRYFFWSTRVTFPWKFPHVFIANSPRTRVRWMRILRLEISAEVLKEAEM